MLITEDYDFGEMTVRQALPLPGVILLALGALSPAERAERLLQVIASAGPSLSGALAVVEPRRLRLRPLSER